MQFFDRGHSYCWPLKNWNFLKQFRAAQFFVQEFFAIDAAISPLCLLDPMRKIDSVAREGEPEYFATGTVDGDACPKPRKKFQFFKGRQHDGLCQKIALEAQRFKWHIYIYLAQCPLQPVWASWRSVPRVVQLCRAPWSCWMASWRWTRPPPPWGASTKTIKRLKKKFLLIFPLTIL